MNSKSDVELNLAVCAVVNRGRVLTAEEIAAWAGLSRNRINQIERSALRKLRVRLTQLGLELSDCVRRLPSEHHETHKGDLSTV